MWCAQMRFVVQILAVGAIVGAPAASQACLWPFCGCGFGYAAYPPPVYAPAPVYAPSPCGPGGCGAFYGPDPCCVPCCDPCGTACPSGSCGAGYATGREPIPDGNQSRPRTYSSEPERAQPRTSTDNVPEDDFQPPSRGNSPPSGTQDRFPPNVTPMGGNGGSAPPPARPLPDDETDGNLTLRVAPVRMRTSVQAQYRLPRVARLDVSPQAPASATAENRVASR